MEELDNREVGEAITLIDSGAKTSRDRAVYTFKTTFLRYSRLDTPSSLSWFLSSLKKKYRVEIF